MTAEDYIKKMLADTMTQLAITLAELDHLKRENDSLRDAVQRLNGGGLADPKKLSP